MVSLRTVLVWIILRVSTLWLSVWSSTILYTGQSITRWLLISSLVLTHFLFNLCDLETICFFVCFGDGTYKFLILYYYGSLYILFGGRLSSPQALYFFVCFCCIKLSWFEGFFILALIVLSLSFSIKIKNM